MRFRVVPVALFCISLWDLHWANISLPEALAGAASSKDAFAVCNQEYLYLFYGRTIMPDAAIFGQQAGKQVQGGNNSIPPLVTSSIHRLSLAYLEEAIISFTEHTGDASSETAAVCIAGPPALEDGNKDSPSESVQRHQRQQQQQQHQALLQMLQHQARKLRMQQVPTSAADSPFSAEQQLQQQVQLLQREVEELRTERNLLRQQLQQREDVLSALSIKVSCRHMFFVSYRCFMVYLA